MLFTIKLINKDELSEVGEKYVDEEVKKALIGIKQMKIMMERNEDKHIDLMKTLKKSSEEKQQALRLMDEVKARLEEEERQCQVSLKNLWDECESCLESTCMRYYTTCKHGVSTFKRKVEDFLRKIPPLIFSFHEDQGKDIQFNEKSEKEDTQLVKMEDLFSQLLSDVGSIFDRSFIFFKHMQKEFDQSFQTFFMSNLDLNESPSMPALPEYTTRNDSSQKGWAMPGFLQIVFDFSKTVFEGVNSDRSGMFSKIVPGRQRPQCKELRENSSGCPQFHERCQKCQDNLLHGPDKKFGPIQVLNDTDFLQMPHHSIIGGHQVGHAGLVPGEVMLVIDLFHDLPRHRDCPNVPELHIKFDEAFKLVNLSGEQYEQILQVVRHHTEDTSYLLNKMKERFGWVSELSNMTIGPESIFNIVKVVPGDPSSKNETVVDVNILTSPTFTIKVPPNLDPESAEFIEYVAGKALQLYKQNF
ncbi:clusterin-like protein 1 [Willisornis vidua]|uniref:Clusterin n=1 Tax=Willisornis vidua TaxID=1566151 RepID=A0ABQ9CL38_9PASS|nr:clusterin-like protein 1 [Willisornis vidua]